MTNVTQRYEGRPRCTWCAGPLWRDASLGPSTRAEQTGVCDDCEVDFYDIQSRSAPAPPWTDASTSTVAPDDRVPTTCQVFIGALWDAYHKVAEAKRGGHPTEPEVAEEMGLSYETFRRRRGACGYTAWKPLAQKLNGSRTVFDLYDAGQD